MTGALRSDTPARWLNLGCGDTFRDGWINVDVHDHGGRVIVYDLNLGIPFADQTFDVVYHSHVLEHFERKRGAFFISECFRVLRPGGLLRIAIPDLEGIVRAYLRALDEERAGTPGAERRHEWMSIELLDQLTRPYSGGEMLEYWARTPMPEREFVLQRCGQEMLHAQEHMRDAPFSLTAMAPLPVPDTRFLRGGELHRWMYDELSLGTLLRETGFADVERCAHNMSRRTEILGHELDGPPDGAPRKPDSLFMEATRPEARNRTTECQLRVATFCSDDSGGAGLAAMRLHDALAQIGVDSLYYVGHLHARHDRVYPALPARGHAVLPVPEHPGEAVLSGYRRYWEQLSNRLRSYSRPEGGELFSLPGACCDPAVFPFIDDFDVLHLHWVTGLIDPAATAGALRGKKLIWTLHDMNPFTGGCHYAGECRKYSEHCGACPQLGSDDPQDAAFATWRNRMAAYRGLDLHIVCPSRWLAAEARRSSLLGRFPVSVIPNGVPLHVFRPLQRASLRQALRVGEEETAFFFPSLAVGVKRKGMDFLCRALQLCAGTNLGSRAVVFIPGNHVPPQLAASGIRIEATGHISAPEHMAVLYNAADGILVPSLEDNLPNVISEACACGTPSVAFASGGIPEMILHKQTGWLTPTGDPAGLLAGMEWIDAVKDHPKVRSACRRHALEQWNPLERARDYVNLYLSRVTR